MAETVRKAHERFPQGSLECSAAIMSAPGLLDIGGAAYFVWAAPPNRRYTAHRHGAERRPSQRPLGGRPKPLRQAAGTDAVVTWSTPQWPTR